MAEAERCNCAATSRARRSFRDLSINRVNWSKLGEFSRIFLGLAGWTLAFANDRVAGTCEANETIRQRWQVQRSTRGFGQKKNFEFYSTARQERIWSNGTLFLAMFKSSYRAGEPSGRAQP